MGGGLQATKNGFTIVELLIVIVVIAILATITVVAFNGIQTNSQSSAALSSVRQVVKKIELYRAENNTNPSDLSVINIQTTVGSTTLQYTAQPDYCVTARVGKVSQHQKQGSAATAEGACPDHTLGPNPINPVPDGLTAIVSSPGPVTSQGTIVFVGNSTGGSFRYIVDQRPNGTAHRLITPSGESNGTFGTYTQKGAKYTLTGEYTGTIWIASRFNNAEHWHNTFRAAHYNRTLTSAEKTLVIQYLSSLLYES